MKKTHCNYQIEANEGLPNSPAWPFMIRYVYIHPYIWVHVIRLQLYVFCIYIGKADRTAVKSIGPMGAVVGLGRIAQLVLSAPPYTFTGHSLLFFSTIASSSLSIPHTTSDPVALSINHP
jgi:hypothetical protein